MASSSGTEREQPVGGEPQTPPQPRSSLASSQGNHSGPAVDEDPDQGLRLLESDIESTDDEDAASKAPRYGYSGFSGGVSLRAPGFNFASPTEIAEMHTTQNPEFYQTMLKFGLDPNTEAGQEETMRRVASAPSQGFWGKMLKYGFDMGTRVGEKEPFRFLKRVQSFYQPVTGLGIDMDTEDGHEEFVVRLKLELREDAIQPTPDTTVTEP